MNTNSLSLPGITQDKNFTGGLAAIVKSTLLLFSLIFPITLLELFLHEGGHAVDKLAQGAPVEILYVHPFSFNGYVRPFSDVNTIWSHASGVVISLSISLIISAVFWRHRTISTLPLTMLFPWIAIKAGFAAINIAFQTGDYFNIIKMTHLPATLFYALSLIFFTLGIFLFVSLFPIMGLVPSDLKTLIVLPASLLLWTSASVLVAYLTVPGSPIDKQFQLKDEILASATSSIPIGAILGLFIAILYVTIYRTVQTEVPLNMQVKAVNLSWRDLQYSAVLFTVSVIVGLVVIT